MLFAPLKTGLGARLQLLRAQPACRRGRRRSSKFCLHLDQLVARRRVPGHLLRRDAIRLAAQVRTRARPSPVLRVCDKTCADRIERYLRNAATRCSSSMAIAPNRPCQKWPDFGRSGGHDCLAHSRHVLDQGNRAA
jgi:hypothetical protein